MKKTRKAISIFICSFILLSSVIPVSAESESWKSFNSYSNNDYSIKKTDASVIKNKTDNLFYTSFSSYTSTWNNTENNGFFIDKEGRVTIIRKYVTVKEKTGIELSFLNEDYEIIGNKKIVLPGIKFGTILNADDGNYYIVSGNNNKEEKNIDVFIITKYDKNWKKTGTVSIKGDSAATTRPFNAGGARLKYIDGKLVLYTSRERYKSADGLNHQSNYAVSVDTKTMKTGFESSKFPSIHVSHSFNQFIEAENGKIYFIDHGDAYPRSIVMQSCELEAFVNEASLWKDTKPVYGGWYENSEGKMMSIEDYNRTRPVETDYFKIQGDIGDNRTGVWISNTGLLSDNGYIVGNATPHNIPVAGKYGDMSSNRNAYVIIFDKEDTTEYKFFWLSKYDPNGKDAVGNIHAVTLSDIEFAILYDVFHDGEYLKTYCVKLNQNGKILGKFEIQARLSDTPPVLKNGKIIWAYVIDYNKLCFAELLIK